MANQKRKSRIPPEEFRIRASPWLQDILDHLINYPLHPKKRKANWLSIYQELKARADTHHTSVNRELMFEARLALSLAVENLQVPTRLFDPYDPESPRAAEYVRKELQPKMERLVMKAILCPGWWRKTDEEPFLYDTRSSPEENPESALVEAFLSDPQLTPREQQLIQEIIRTDFIGDAAAAMGILASTARSMLIRIRPKLAKYRLL